MKTTSETPWGAIQSTHLVAPGIQVVTTASHGGVVLTPDRAAEIPTEIAPFTRDRRFWEEDCDIAVPMLLWWEEFSADHRQRYGYDEGNLAEMLDQVVSTLKWRDEAGSHRDGALGLLADARAKVGKPNII